MGGRPVTAQSLWLLPGTSSSSTRTSADRLEVLTTLTMVPTFDPFYRDDILVFPSDHPVYQWLCRLPGCERAQNPGDEHCRVHRDELARMRKAGAKKADFLRDAKPLVPRAWHHPPSCVICPSNPAIGRGKLCWNHYNIWNTRRRSGESFDTWCSRQRPYPGFGTCQALVCPDPAGHPVGLCARHMARYTRDGKPGRASVPSKWASNGHTRPPVTYSDWGLFVQWCQNAEVICRNNGKVSLLGLAPLVKAEIQWCLFTHTQGSATATWSPLWVQHLVNHCRAQQIDSLVDLDLGELAHFKRLVAKAMLRYLQPIYLSPADTKEAGFIQTEHFGVFYAGRGHRIELIDVSQRWLRGLLWDMLTLRLTTDPPRSRQPLDQMRRGCIDLSAYLEAQAPGGGHDPALLTAEVMTGFVADLRNRAEHGLESLALVRVGHGPDRRRTTVTKCMMARTFNGARRVLRAALESGAAGALGLDRGFVVALPVGRVPKGRRRPFSDEVARALALEANLRNLEELDPNGRGMREIWEALVLTGRRCSEVLNLRLECIGRLNGLPMFWHDQTKVGNLDDAIRIPERLFERLERRQAETVAWFVDRHRRPPTERERKKIALFPARTSNRNLINSISYTWFNQRFRAWIDTLDIGHCVPHQARHTLATNLLRNGADLTHVKRYLGHVSEEMAEHYVHLANTDPRLEDALQAVWVSGPGSAEPGVLLSEGEPMTRERALALAIDLTRKSTPAEGGFCTYQPVVDGGACPWNLNCENCDKFVMSGADLVYWRRKREQWRMLAERAPDSATADFLHEVFEPTARAIAGLERALEAVGLLEEALALDLRRPQDYFGKVWSLAFRAKELTSRGEDGEAA